MEKKNLLFIHIDKTGGTSIVSGLKLSKLEPHTTGGSKQDNWNYKYKHYSYKQYCKEFKSPNLKKYFVFSFVRNPYTWVISRFNFLRNMNYDQSFYNNHKHNSVKFANHTGDINQYILKLYNSNSKPFPKSQTEYLLNNQDKIDVDFIGNFESLESDFDNLLDILKLDKEQYKLPVINSYNNSNQKDNILTERSKQIIFEWYKKDFENFNYSR